MARLAKLAKARTMGGLQDYRDQLEHLASIDRIRSLRPRVGIDFASNDYLALGAAPRLAEAVREAMTRDGEGLDRG